MTLGIQSERWRSLKRTLNLPMLRYGSFTGFIKVHLRLSRPRTSFYLPSDCVKQIHIGSLTTTSEVIQGLLKKFMVLDDPRKFALYRQTHRDGQDLFQKLPLSEHPLVLRLIAGPDAEQLTFVLKENETGEVEVRQHTDITEEEEEEQNTQVRSFTKLFFCKAPTAALTRSIIFQVLMFLISYATKNIHDILPYRYDRLSKPKQL
uniref:Ras association domain family member 5 n=1 Tax=Fundulus heteroclitus TaxID=8078 RepID=A0A3Q2R0P5_FUNHE